MAKKSTSTKAAKPKTVRAKPAAGRTKSTTVTLAEALRQLERLGDEGMRAYNAKGGAGDNQFGVQLGDIRTLAKKIKTNHELAMSLWETGNVDAQHLATLLIEPRKLAAKEMDRMVRSISYVRVADWLNSYVVRKPLAKCNGP
jgi:3-methyladenine DNA glycosylase AlkD